MSLKSFIFPDVALGLNTRDPQFNLRPGETQTAINVLPVAGGTGFRKRDGQRLFNAPPTGSRFQTLYEWPEKDLLIASIDNDVYSCPRISSGTWTKRFDSVVATQQPWQFEIAKDGAGLEKLWMVNGSNAPQKWDGVTATTVAWAGGIPPAGCTWLKLWKNRLVAGGNPANPERLYYSAIGNPELPNPWNFIDIRSAYDDSDPITWAELIGDNLLVFKRNSTWLVYDSNTFANRRLGYPGCPHLNLSANLRGDVYFLASDGLYVTDGITDPVPVDQKVPMKMSSIQTNNKVAFVVADPGEERLLIVLPVSNFSTGALTDTQPYLFYPPKSKNNPRNEATWWSLSFRDNPTAAAYVEIQRVGDTVKSFSMLGGSAFNGGITIVTELLGDAQQMVDQNTVNTASFNSTYSFGPIKLVEYEKAERVRRVNLRMKPTCLFSMTGMVGSVSVAAVTDTIGNVGFARVRPEARAREFFLTFSSTLTTSLFEVHGIELMFRGGKEHTK